MFALGSVDPRMSSVDAQEGAPFVRWEMNMDVAVGVCAVSCVKTPFLVEQPFPRTTGVAALVMAGTSLNQSIEYRFAVALAWQVRSHSKEFTRSYSHGLSNLITRSKGAGLARIFVQSGRSICFLVKTVTLVPGLKFAVDEMLVPGVGEGIDPFRELRLAYDRCTAKDHGNRLLELDLATYLHGDILRKVDRASMHVSLEVRCPLLDPKIVAQASRMPLDWKLKGRTGKRVLKQAFKHWIPARHMRRPKQGFVIPLANWLRGPLREERNAAIRGAFASEYFRKETLARYVKEHDAGMRDRSEALWAVLMLHGWFERWGRE